MTDDPTILDAMLKNELGKAQAAASALGRKFQRLADFLEDMADVKSDDREQIMADLVRANAATITPYYDQYTAAVRAVRDLTQEY